MSQATEKQFTLQTLGNHLNSHVHNVCVFGSTNLGNSRRADREYLKYMKAIHNIFRGATQACFRKLLKHSTSERSELFLLLAAMKLKCKVITCGGNGAHGIFNAGEDIVYLPIKDATSNKFMEMVTVIYPMETNLDVRSLQTSDFYSVFASHLSTEAIIAYGDSLLEKNDNMFKRAVSDEALYKEFLNKKSFNNKSDKECFLRNTIRHVKNGAYFHGVGNCELMADIACLEAIFQPHDHDIHYVRFTRTSGVVDELNCIVLGDWPNAGCQVVAPWLPAEKRLFTWQGSIVNTPELSSINQNYNHARQIIHITPVQKEKFKTQLVESGYAHWLSSETREHNLKTVKECAEQFFTFASECAKKYSEGCEQKLKA